MSSLSMGAGVPDIGGATIAKYLAPGCAGSQNSAMESGTSVARSPRMNDRPLAPLPTQIAEPRAPEARPQEEDPRRAQEEELDKYDISTLACTD
jgi:hypothetical protein